MASRSAALRRSTSTSGVISPGGVGYDINCGVRLMASKLTREQIPPRIRELVNQLFRDVPTGVGAAGAFSVPGAGVTACAERGARWAVDNGLGGESDLDHIEENGCTAGADPAASFAACMEERPRTARYARLGQSFS